MWAFIDESGDPGRKIAQGSSTHFVVGVVTFDDADDLRECDERIASLRAELSLRTDFEFHFRQNSHAIRLAFLHAVNRYPWFYHVFGLNKDPAKLHGPGFDEKETLYKFACRRLLEEAKPYLLNATVTIDGSGDRRFRQELQTYLRKRINTAEGVLPLKKFKAQNSAANNMLQLADYVVGVANRTIRCGEKNEYRSLVAGHEITFNVWPR